MAGSGRESLQTFPDKPRVFVLSDISNEPDDAESLVRYLTYANQFDTEGLVAVTSIWLKDRTCEDDMHSIVDGYTAVWANLNAHSHPAHPYPEPDQLRALIKPGAPVYGMAAVGDDVPLSEGGALLKARIEAAPSCGNRPLWVLCWGGTNVLAQALYALEREHGATKAKEHRSRVRVYAISDQDDSPSWLRARYPDLFYISSVHAMNMYGLATWAGISGEAYYDFDEGGPDPRTIDKAWVRDRIQIGPLGAAYPDPMFVFEGDTPTFLYLVQNGLGSREHPHWGSWGGRYARTDAGTTSNHHGDTADRVVGASGRAYKSNQATVWRWRTAFQHDFAARMQWTLSADFAAANHHPVVVLSLNGDQHRGHEPLRLDAVAGSSLELDASASYDPDAGDRLTFRWFQYKEPSFDAWSAHKFVGELAIEPLGDDGACVRVRVPPADRCCVEFKTSRPVPRGQLLHLILEVADSGEPCLTTYKRVVIQTLDPSAKGL